LLARQARILAQFCETGDLPTMALDAREEG